MVKIMGISDIAAAIQQFKIGMIKEYNIYLQISESNKCAVCGDPDVLDKDYEYPYGKKERGCCNICYKREFVGAPSIEDGLNGYE